jgi:lysophospholipid acyltransferase (LPLAT)-like uncharacterized protein
MDASPKWVMNTWDKKKQPLPFSKITIRYHEPVYIRGDFTDADIENLEAVLSQP